jgi:chitin synthase
MSASSRGDHHHLGAVTEEGGEESANETDSETVSTVPQNKRDDLVNPYWIEDPDVRKGEVEFLSSNEILFWKDLLDKYLYPIDENKEEKVKYINFLFPF